MTTVTKRNNGRSGLLSMSSPFDRFFRNDFTDLWDKQIPATIPSINISEGKNNYKIEVAAPGLKKEEINIDVDGNLMTISSEKESETFDGKEGDGKEKEEQTYSRREYNYSSFSRSFTIPENADGENIKANYKDGVLNIEIPKKKENQQNNRQKIKIE
jgi:HSP20 family protein